MFRNLLARSRTIGHCVHLQPVPDGRSPSVGCRSPGLPLPTLPACFCTCSLSPLQPHEVHPSSHHTPLIHLVSTHALARARMHFHPPGHPPLTLLSVLETHSGSLLLHQPLLLAPAQPLPITELGLLTESCGRVSAFPYPIPGRCHNSLGASHVYPICLSSTGLSL